MAKVVLEITMVEVALAIVQCCRHRFFGRVANQR